ncbi:hypothetical protein M5K25_010700 [Dendrobium thyrsiflorum]|uniref:Uncharacterized protein n=1 Tax=Dendrobium thyrsiflorum TaxID=117978 RepID=A0ABD0V0S0_DENTH
MLRQEPNVVEGAKPNSDEGGVDRRSARKGEGYLHSWRSPVVASDQNVVTSDPMEGSRERSEVERRRREPHTERPSSFYRHRRSCDVRGVLTTCEVVRRSTNAPQQMWYASRANHVVTACRFLTAPAPLHLIQTYLKQCFPQSQPLLHLEIHLQTQNCLLGSPAPSAMLYRDPYHLLLENINHLRNSYFSLFCIFDVVEITRQVSVGSNLSSASSSSSIFSSVMKSPSLIGRLAVWDGNVLSPVPITCLGRSPPEKVRAATPVDFRFLVWNEYFFDSRTAVEVDFFLWRGQRTTGSLGEFSKVSTVRTGVIMGFLLDPFLTLLIGGGGSPGSCTGCHAQIYFSFFSLIISSRPWPPDLFSLPPGPFSGGSPNMQFGCHTPMFTEWIVPSFSSLHPRVGTSRRCSQKDFFSSSVELFLFTHFRFENPF